MKPGFHKKTQFDQSVHLSKSALSSFENKYPPRQAAPKYDKSYLPCDSHAAMSAPAHIIRAQAHIPRADSVAMHAIDTNIETQVHAYSTATKTDELGTDE